jgi:hypothetical protein
VTLHDGDVARLARQVVDLLDPTLDIRIDPASMYDPYRRGQQRWRVVVPTAHGEVTIPVAATMSPVDAVEALLDGVRNSHHPFPPCRPGHDHPSRLAEARDGAPALICPQTAEVVVRFGGP